MDFVQLVRVLVELERSLVRHLVVTHRVNSLLVIIYIYHCLLFVVVM